MRVKKEDKTKVKEDLVNTGAFGRTNYESAIKAAFDIFDLDKNGSLSMIETWTALYYLGLKGISADQVVRFFDLMDDRPSAI